jgi:hypothetical protein
VLVNRGPCFVLEQWLSVSDNSSLVVLEQWLFGSESRSVLGIRKVSLW